MNSATNLYRLPRAAVRLLADSRRRYVIRPAPVVAVAGISGSGMTFAAEKSCGSRGTPSPACQTAARSICHGPGKDD
jgi:hypothetical protein